MIFSSAVFLFAFLPILLIGYFIFPAKFTGYKNIFLLVASLLFFIYGSPKHLLLLLLSILINFHMGLFIDRCKENKKSKRLYLWLGVTVNLALLFYFKYTGFALTNVNRIFGANITVPNIILPIGISFFTFQGMAYFIDVYRGTANVNRSIIDIALYISLFPKILAGPIVSYKNTALQLRERRITAKSFGSGIDKFIIGLSKKLLIADTLGTSATKIFSMFSYGMDVPSIWLAVICYTLQIYFDFSAYSDMAIGLGRMFGFDFLENFDYPYMSLSISDFWKRWHISLTTWFRNYVYLPLSSSLVKRKWKLRSAYLLASFVVWFLTGLWHGAQWQFMLWGIWHCAFLAVENILLKRSSLERIPNGIRWVATMFVVAMGWVMFNASSISNAIQIYQTLLGLKTLESVEFSFVYFLDRKVVCTLIAATVGSTPLLSVIGKKLENSVVMLIAKRVALIASLLLCIISVVSGAYSPFVYFRF